MFRIVFLSLLMLFSKTVFASQPSLAPDCTSAVTTSDLQQQADGTLIFAQQLQAYYGSSRPVSTGPVCFNKLLQIEEQASRHNLLQDRLEFHSQGHNGRWTYLSTDGHFTHRAFPQGRYAAEENAGLSFLTIAPGGWFFPTRATITAEVFWARLWNYNTAPGSSSWNPRHLNFVRDNYIQFYRNRYGTYTVTDSGTRHEARLGNDVTVRFARHGYQNYLHAQGVEVNASLQELAASAALLWQRYPAATARDLHNALIHGVHVNTRKINLRRSAHLLQHRLP